MSVRTGREYVEALRDGRRVWQGGRLIEDVPSHPGFSGTVQSLARLYDAQHAPELFDRLTVDWQGERISYRYHPPQSAEDLARKRSHTEYWAEETLGQMGRLPDYCAEMTVGLLDVAELLEPDGAKNARNYHRLAAERDLSLTHALNDQFYDRRKRVSEQADPDLVLHVVRETADGPIVRGLRNLATMAPLCDEVLVHPNAPRGVDEVDYAICFALPMNAPGLKVVCRDLYAEHADPERLPLTTRFDEVDATLIFDDVLVPWERVFVYRNPPLAQRYHATVLLWAAWVSTVRLLTKLRFFIGVAQLLSEWSGREPRTLLGRLLQDLEILRACLVAAEAEGYRKPSGLWAPRLNEAHRLHGIEASDRAEQLMEQILTSYLIQTGGPSDLSAPEIGPLVSRYFAAGAPSTRDHLRLLAVAGDLVQSAFANRNQLYERLWGGEPDAIRQRLHRNTDLSAFTAPVLCFIRDGWDVRWEPSRTDGLR
jgi:4-hydroxyphenylacetate 3-monooxygenase/anthranilate 3-monooxygenase (FAD)/4-hydroxyphenylacetate 3-monooxygenase